MCDVFMPEEFGDMFRNQHIIILGGSQMRGLYKDMVWLLNHPSFIPNEVLGAKSENRFPDLEKTEWKGQKPVDELYEIFDKENRDYLTDSRGLTSGRTYIEPRWYHNKKYKVTINYMFSVQAHTKELEEFLLSYENKFGAPISTIIMNSTLWDVNRFGPHCVREYRKNIQKLLKIVPQVLPKDDGSFIWLTCPLVSEETQSRGMNVAGLEFQCFFTRYNVVEANAIAAFEVSRAGYGVVDLHYIFQLQQFRRKPDGIHWNCLANRMITNIILTYIQLWRRGDGEDNGLTGRIGNNDDNKEPTKPWEEQNFALEVAKLKAKKIKEGPKSEDEVKDALDDLESNLDPTKGRTCVSKDIRNTLDRKAVQHRMAEKQNTKRNEYLELYPVPNNSNQMVNRYHPYQRPDGSSQPMAQVNPMPQMNPGAPLMADRFDEDPVMLDMDFRAPEERINPWNNRMGMQNQGGGGMQSGDNLRNQQRGYDLDSFDDQPNNNPGYVINNKLLITNTGSLDSRLSPAEIEMMNQQLRIKVEDYFKQWNNMPNDTWRKLMREEVIKSILNPMGGMVGPGGGMGGPSGGMGGQGGAGFDMDMGGQGVRSFMDGANAFNDMHQGDYNYTDFSGGPMRRPHNMRPGNMNQGSNNMNMIQSGFGNFNNPYGNFGGMNNMGQGGNEMFNNQGNQPGPNMNGAVNRMIWGNGFGRGGMSNNRGGYGNW